MTDNGIRYKGAISMSEMLESNTTLTSLGLAGEEKEK